MTIFASHRRRAWNGMLPSVENIFFDASGSENFAITASCNADQYSGIPSPLLSPFYKGPKSNYFERFTRSTESKSNHWKTIESRKKVVEAATEKKRERERKRGKRGKKLPAIVLWTFPARFFASWLFSAVTVLMAVIRLEDYVTSMST